MYAQTWIRNNGIILKTYYGQVGEGRRADDKPLRDNANTKEPAN